MEKCLVGGRLKRLDITDSSVVLELGGNYSELLREDDSRQTRRDILESFEGEPVEITIQCYTPHLRKKTRRALDSA